jgi:hypothetical protein
MSESDWSTSLLCANVLRTLRLDEYFRHSSSKTRAKRFA